MSSKSSNEIGKSQNLHEVPVHSSLNESGRSHSTKNVVFAITSTNNVTDKHVNNTSPLTQEQVTNLRKLHGLNIIEASKNPSWIIFLFRAFVHPFNILLCILASTSAALKEYGTTGIMLFMVVTSAGLRFSQEYKSQKAAQSLLSLVSKKVCVIRRQVELSEAREEEVPTEDLVPGDLVRLHPGELIPADIKVIESKDLYVSQASLTGEAIPVEKFAMTDKNMHHFTKAVSIPSISPAMLDATNTNATSATFRDTGIGNTTINMSNEELIQSSTKQNNCFAKASNGRVIKFFRNLFGLRVDLESDPFADQIKTNLDVPNLCYMGTSVVTGNGTAIVQTTGSSTYFGRMAKELGKRRPQNAFQLGVRRISWIFFITMSCLVPPVLLLQGFLNGNWSEALLFALSVAVGLTPEMLPMIVNTTLAKGAVEMSHKKCIVKNLDAIVNMGGIDVLCTDKTGTLTKSIVVLTKHINQLGQNSKVPLNLAYLNAHFQSTMSNPLDDAVSKFCEKNKEETQFTGIGSETIELIQTYEAVFGNGMNPSMSDLANKFIVLDEVPFDFLRRRVSVLIKSKNESSTTNLMICKGAVDETLSICTKIFLDDHLRNPTEEEDRVIPEKQEVSDITPVIIQQLTDMNEDLNDEGLRVIAVAYKLIPPDQLQIDVSSECDLIFAGFLAFLDPPKESTADAIKKLMEYNVEIKVLTGDSPSVCKKICQEINLPVKSVVRSTDLEGATDEQVSALAKSGTIFAKLTPLQKADIIRALKRNGNIVGFLGDGINDSPALTEADVGISVESATDIAKDSADIILLEKNIGVVVDGVIIGRATYGNTIKYIVMAVSSNFGNVFSLLVASSWLPFLPMKPIHLLVQNLLYDISQIAIPWDHMDTEFLAVPHRWSMKSVLRFMVCLGPWSSVFDITTFAYMYFYYGIKTEKDNVPLFQTTWFTVGLLTQTMIVHMIRTAKIPFIQSRASLPLIVMTIFIMGLGLALPYIPELKIWLGMVTLKPMIYPYIAGAIICYCFAAQLAKVIYKLLFHEWF